jgi:transcription initiation factor IIE alpha subunit
MTISKREEAFLDEFINSSDEFVIKYTGMLGVPSIVDFAYDYFHFLMKDNKDNLHLTCNKQKEKIIELQEKIIDEKEKEIFHCPIQESFYKLLKQYSPDGTLPETVVEDIKEVYQKNFSFIVAILEKYKHKLKEINP